MSIETTVMGLKKPVLNDMKGDTIAELAANFELIAALYPIGTIYQSTKNVNPSTFIKDTTWSPISGRVLVAQSTDFPAGTTGGAKEVTLTAQALPKTPASLVYSNTNASHLSLTSYVTGPGWVGGDVENLHGGKAHENMPPYKSVYMWERTA